MKPEQIKAYLEYFPHLEVSPSSAAINPNNCAVIERTADGVNVGACLFYLKDGKTCPRHGIVKRSTTPMTNPVKPSIEPLRKWSERHGHRGVLSIPGTVVSQALAAYDLLQREVESLRGALMDQPADVQEAVIRKLGLVSGEALESAQVAHAQAIAQRDQAHAALKTAKEYLNDWVCNANSKEALDAIKDCGL